MNGLIAFMPENRNVKGGMKYVYHKDFGLVNDSKRQGNV